ncbi:M24 family metallopeptidase [Haloplanus halobius]|uniref:M24 family metallopeptidase n=1 Tax=Haloplanus halobius TaxID=2934938 RepID=UPI00200C3BD5
MTAGAAAEPALAAASAGVVAVATRLADATVTDDRLHDAESDPLTAADLERVADAAVARHGGDAADTTVEPAGTLRAGTPIMVSLTPRVDGVTTPLSRTFVVDGAGGWERRAAVAVGMAHDAVRRVVEPTLPARRVVEEAVAELGAYGLTAAGDVARGVRVADGDPPDFSTDDSLAAGQVFALAPTATAPAPDHGHVRIGTCYAVTESGCRVLDATPTSLSPVAY